MVLSNIADLNSTYCSDKLWMWNMWKNVLPIAIIYKYIMFVKGVCQKIPVERRTNSPEPPGKRAGETIKCWKRNVDHWYLHNNHSVFIHMCNFAFHTKTYLKCIIWERLVYSTSASLSFRPIISVKKRFFTVFKLLFCRI